MQRLVGLILLMFLGVIFVVSSSVVRSQEPEERVLISAELLNDYLDVQKIFEPIDLTPVSNPMRSVDIAHDSCSDSANNLPTFSQNGINYLSGDSTNVTGFGIGTTSADPGLVTCMTGSPSNSTGYRTAWYRFIAPASGMLRAETVFNGNYADIYDTILAIYTAESCNTLVQLTCNDDTNGLLSKAETFVIQDQVYYIEVADHNLAVNGTAQLNLAVSIESQDFSATEAGWNTDAVTRSRHATAIVGDDIYLFGGQTIVNGVGATRIARVDKFNTVSGEWTALAAIPATCAGDPHGYSNTSAAYVKRNGVERIYLPAGYVGSNGAYAGNHCIYDIATDSWSLGASAWTGAGTTPAAFVATAERAGIGYFIAGGLTGRWIDDPAVDNGKTVRAYLPSADNWTVYPDLPNGRYAHTAVLLGSELCVMGGLRTFDDAGIARAELIPDGICINIDIPNSWQPISGPTIARFHASSAIGPDGRWYIWGGVNGTLDSVREIEVYDAATDSWEKLDGRYYLEQPARSWAQGGFVGKKLWVLGGETNFRLTSTGTEYEANVTGVVERLDIPLKAIGNLTKHLFLPVLMRATPQNGLLPQSQRITMNTSLGNNFNNLADTFDVYHFTLGSTESIDLKLSHIPSGGDNYDLYLYNANKLLLETSNNVGNNDELISADLAAGTYFVIVVAEDNFLLAIGDYWLSLSK